jgi:hypothetical protein
VLSQRAAHLVPNGTCVAPPIEVLFSIMLLLEKTNKECNEISNYVSPHQDFHPNGHQILYSILHYTLSQNYGFGGKVLSQHTKPKLHVIIENVVHEKAFQILNGT